jgi:hypothetical protein
MLSMTPARFILITAVDTPLTRLAAVPCSAGDLVAGSFHADSRSVSGSSRLTHWVKCATFGNQSRLKLAACTGKPLPFLGLLALGILPAMGSDWFGGHHRRIQDLQPRSQRRGFAFGVRGPHANATLQRCNGTSTRNSGVSSARRERRGPRAVAGGWP